MGLTRCYKTTVFLHLSLQLSVPRLSVLIFFDELEHFHRMLTACVHPEVSMKGRGTHFVVT